MARHRSRTTASRLFPSTTCSANVHCNIWQQWSDKCAAISSTPSRCYCDECDARRDIGFLSGGAAARGAPGDNEARVCGSGSIPPCVRGRGSLSLKLYGMWRVPLPPGSIHGMHGTWYSASREGNNASRMPQCHTKGKEARMWQGMSINTLH